MCYKERLQEKGTNGTQPEKEKKKWINCNRNNEYVSDKGNI
jgi:hypothetical protein